MNKEGFFEIFGIGIVICMIICVVVQINILRVENDKLNSNTCYLKCGEGFKDSYRIGDYPYLRCVKLENKELKECYIDYPRKDAKDEN